MFQIAHRDFFFLKELIIIDKHFLEELNVRNFQIVFTSVNRIWVFMFLHQPDSSNMDQPSRIDMVLEGANSKNMRVFFTLQKKQNKCPLALTVTTVDLAEPPMKSSIQENKDEILSLQKTRSESSGSYLQALALY